MSESKAYKLTEVISLCHVSKENIEQFIQEQWIIPADAEDFFFDDEDIERIKLIDTLMQDWGVNDEAVPIILHLIDQLNHLHRELQKKH